MSRRVRLGLLGSVLLLGGIVLAAFSLPKFFPEGVLSSQ